MFQLLLTLLRILFPLDPVAQRREVTRFFVTSLLEDLANPDRLQHLETCPDCRMRLEDQIASAEDGIQQAIHERARQIAGFPFVFVHRNHEHPPRWARPLDQILARLHRMLALHKRIEERARRRAATIERELEANPPCRCFASIHLPRIRGGGNMPIPTHRAVCLPQCDALVGSTRSIDDRDVFSPRRREKPRPWPTHPFPAIENPPRLALTCEVAPACARPKQKGRPCGRPAKLVGSRWR